MSTKTESHWIVSATLRKKRPARTLSLYSAKITTPSAAEILKRVRWSPVTAFIGDLIKSNGGNRLTIAGIVTNRRKSSSAAGPQRRRQSLKKSGMQKQLPKN